MGRLIDRKACVDVGNSYAFADRLPDVQTVQFDNDILELTEVLGSAEHPPKRRAERCFERLSDSTLAAVGGSDGEHSYCGRRATNRQIANSRARWRGP